MNNKVKNIKRDVGAMFEVLAQIQTGECRAQPLPLVCLEGLPGAGKTTQLERIQKRGRKRLGRAHFVDLPSQLSVGKLLSKLYKNQETFWAATREVPWLNLILITTNLHLEFLEARRLKSDYVLMSRGLLSTFFYNYQCFLHHDLNHDEAVELLDFFLKGFILPSSVVYLDIPIEVAHERVVKRNREPLRHIDTLKGLEENKRFFQDAFRLFENRINILKIDGNRKLNSVTNDIVESIAAH